MSETLTTEQVEELLAGCEGATPGPWGEGDKWVFASPRDGNPSSALENILRNEEAQANAAHIARLDPQTVASLATELLVLRKRVEWQDISTAPKDGSVILVWDEDVGHCDVCRWSGHHQCWHQLQWGVGDPPVDEDMVGWTVYYPVRWMPLPTPKEPS